MLGLPAASAAIVQTVLGKYAYNGEDLQDLNEKRLQRLLDKESVPNAAALAQQTLALHQAALGAAPAESKLATARGAAEAARAALRRNRVALRSQVVQLVSLASRHFPELRAHEAVRQVSGAFSSLARSVLTEIYLRHAWSCHKI
eukprot:COSAG01_NODE_991_length_12286_cov_4.629605_19_plen_145_part_00